MPDIVGDGDNLGDHIATKSFKQIKGTDVASGDAVTLGFGGNTFDITGTTTINHINNTNWVVGSVMILHFDGAVTLTNNAGGLTGSEANILLSGDTNFTSSAGDALSFVLHDSTNWVEISRNVPSSSYTEPTLGSTPLPSGATTATIAGLTLTSPTFSTPVLGTVASGSILTNATGLPQSGVVSLVSDLALKAGLTTNTFTGVQTFSDDINIDLTKKLYLDGGGDTYLSNAGTNYVDLICGGNRAFRGNASLFEFRSYKKVGDPVVGDLNIDQAQVIENTTSGDTFLCYNNGGTLQKILITSSGVSESMIISASDELTSLTVGTAKTTFRMPYAFTLTAVKVSLTNTSTGGNPTIDINESGTSILSSPVAITAGQKTATATVGDSSLANLAEMTVDIDVAGTNASGLKIYLIGSQT